MIMDGRSKAGPEGRNLRPWGYVSARVVRLGEGEVLRLTEPVTRFVVISGGLRIDGDTRPLRAIFASGEAPTVDVPKGNIWSVCALTDLVLVLYSER